MTEYKNKEELINHLVKANVNTKSKLTKMKHAELQYLYNNLKPVPVEKKNKREVIVRNFSDDDEDGVSDSDDEKEVDKKKPVEQVQSVQITPSLPVIVVEDKIKAPELKIPEKSSVIQYSVSELRKYIRGLFTVYNKDIKLIIKDYQSNLIDQSVLVDDYNNLRDDFVESLNQFLNTQKKLSDSQYTYIDGLLERSASSVEKIL
tara:strand:+ start:2914 stop:3525 length:612 start_codon:yes stop_codon:yes gene_type:complete